MSALRLPASLLRATLRVIGPLLLSERLPVTLRRRLLEAGSGRARLPAGVKLVPGTLGGVDGEWVVPAAPISDAALLYLHGGGYVLGSPRTHRALVGRLVARLGVSAFVPDYRLAPEHPHPAALDDVLTAYRELVADGTQRVIVAGDSAGGGLAVALAQAVRDAGLPAPVALGLIGPWLDLAADHAGRRPPRRREPLLTPGRLHRWAQAYAAGSDASNPAISPLHGDLAGLPPIVLHDAGDDPLCGDGDRLVELLRGQGGEIEQHRHHGMWHAFQIHAGVLAAADQALDVLGDALRRHLGLQAPRVAIIGAGMSGLCMASQLRANGMEDFTIFEKADEVGGTWRENRYPGLTCDVPSRFYSYSFAPNPGWSHSFAPGAEILEYFKRVSADLGVRDHVRFASEVVAARWQNGCWELEISDGTRDTADVVVSATGVLHHPRLPAIAGLERFAGPSFHSARWDETAVLDGKRVGVIGTGSTGVQIVTAIAGKAGRLSVFQRTPQWILPMPNRRYSRITQAIYRRLPVLNHLAYRGQQRQLEAVLGAAVARPGWERSLVSGLCRLNLRFGVRDPDLRRRLTPGYVPMCKRLVMSAGFYPAMQRPDVDLVTEQIDHVEERGVVTADGRLHELDVLVLATGFDAHAFMRPMKLEGEDGMTIDEAWAAGPRAYRTVALPGFPNFFMLMGPHSPFGNQSLISVAEAQAGYVLQWIERFRRGEVRAARPTPEATDRFNEELRAAIPGTIWTTGCQSWYMGPDGLPELWPWSPADHRAILREPALEDFELEHSPRTLEGATQ